jgi:hypothetical protein
MQKKIPRGSKPKPMLPGDEKIMPSINIWMEGKKSPGTLNARQPPGKSAQRSVVSAVD